MAHALCVWLTLAILPFTAHGADVSVTTTVGFADRFQPGAWTPIRLSVQNLGPAFDAHVSVSLAGGNALEGNAHRITARRTVHLASGVRRQLHFTLFVESYAHPLEVTLARERQIVFRSKTELRARYSEQRVLLVYADGADLDYLGGITSGACSRTSSRECTEAQGAGLARAYVHREQLPHVWYGYDGVDALVVHGRDLSGLADSQFSALIGWLSKGGRLIVSGTANLALMRTARLQALLPAAPRGLVSNQPALDSAGDASSTPALTLHDIADGPHVHARLGERALLAERALGRGAVVYLTADVAHPAFAQWARTPALWRRALGRGDARAFSRGPPADTATPGADEVLSRVSASFRARIRAPDASWVDDVLLELPVPWPSLITVLVFGFGYLAILAAADPSRASTARHRTALAVLPGAIGGIVALGLFALPATGGPNLVSLAMVERLPDDPYANVRYELGIFSRDRARWTWHTAGTAPAWRHVPRPATKAPQTAQEVRAAAQEAVHWRFDYGNAARAIPAHSASVEPIRPYVVETLVGEDVMYLPSGARLIHEGVTAAVEIINDGPVHWHASWLVSPTAIVSTGPFGVGARSTYTARAGTDSANGAGMASSDWQPRLVAARPGPGYPHFAIARAISRRMGILRDEHPEQLWLVAMTDNPLPLGVDAAEPGQLASYGVMIIPVTASRARRD